ncbi:MAG: DUF4062 domain-containing protein [Verrucomicrobiota bacterium]
MIDSQDRVIRVFISSTFRDMMRERDLLVKEVFPELRRKCAKRFVTFTEVDLRWGITEEQANEGQVLPLCLAEIERSRPYFIGLLGERYGWIPDTIRPEIIEREPWLKEHVRDRTSVTELEILHGVLNDPEMKGLAFFYFRDSAYVTDPSLTADERRDMIERNIQADVEKYGEPEATRRTEERKAKLTALKERIRDSKLPLVDPYANPKALAEIVRKQFDELIDQLYPEDQTPDLLARERMAHEAHAKSKLFACIDRPAHLKALNDFAAPAEHDGKGLIVTGESGSGKTSLLAAWVRDWAKTHPEDFLFQHYFGATPDSASPEGFLRRLLGELKARFGITDDIPADAEKLRDTLPVWLAQTIGRGRIVLVLDGLNQVQGGDPGRHLHFLPPHFPPHVTAIASALAGPALDALRKRGWADHDLPLANAAEVDGMIGAYMTIHARTLEPELRRQLVTAPGAKNPLFLRTVLEELRQFGSFERLSQRVAHYLEASGPKELFLRVIHRWQEDFDGKDPEQDKPKIDLVRRALTHLWAARQGLSEPEWLDLLGWHSQSARSHSAVRSPESEIITPLPRALWTPLLLALEPHLTQRSGLLTFGHAYMREAVEVLFLPDDRTQRAAHRAIAQYFSLQPWFLEDAVAQQRRQLRPPNSARPVSARKVMELPWQLLKACHWDAAAALLIQPDFLEAKTEAGLAYELIEDFAAALQAMPSSHPLRPTLSLLEESILRDIHFIAGHVTEYPQGLFQCIYNAFAPLLEPTPGAAVAGRETTIPEVGRAGVSALLREWGSMRSAKGFTCPWFRTLRPLRRARGRMRMELDASASLLAVSPDGEQVAAGEDKQLSAWDASIGRPVFRISLPHAMLGLCWSADGKSVLAALSDGRVAHVDRTGMIERLSGEPLGSEVRHASLAASAGQVIFAREDRIWIHTLHGVETATIDAGAAVSSLLISGDGALLSWGCGDGRWSVRDRDGRIILCGKADTEVISLAFTTDKRALIVGCEDGSLTVASLGGGATTVRLKTPPCSVQPSPDGRLLFVTTFESNALAIDLESLSSPPRPYMEHGDRVVCVSFSLDGKVAASAGAEGRVLLWHVPLEPDPEPDTSAPVNCVCVSRDGEAVAVGCHDGTVWTFSRGARSGVVVSRHGGPVYGINWSGPHNLLASGGADGFVRVVDPTTGAIVTEIKAGFEVTAVSLSPDGKLLAAAGQEARLWIWSIPFGMSLSLPVQVGPRSSQQRRMTFSELNGPPTLLVLDVPDSQNEQGPRTVMSRNIVGYAKLGNRYVMTATGSTISAMDNKWAVRPSGELLMAHLDGVAIEWMPGGHFVRLMRRFTGVSDVLWDAESGQHVRLDVKDVMSSSGCVMRKGQQSASMELLRHGSVVGWFNHPLSRYAASPDGGTWGGATGCSVYHLAAECTASMDRDRGHPARAVTPKRVVFAYGDATAFERVSQPIPPELLALPLSVRIAQWKRAAEASYVAADYAEAERLLANVTRSGSADGDVYVSLAQLHAVAGSEKNARSNLDLALSFNSSSPTAVIARILWMQVLFAYMDGREAESVLSAMKHVLVNLTTPAGWPLLPVWERLKGKLAEDARQLTRTIAEALTDPERRSSLEDFPAWRGTGRITEEAFRSLVSPKLPPPRPIPVVSARVERVSGGMPRAVNDAVNQSRHHSAERPKESREPTIEELRAFADQAHRRCLWDVAASIYDKLLMAGDPLEEVGPRLVTCLMNVREKPLEGDIERAEKILQQLERSGHADLIAPLRQQLQAKLAVPRKKWWRWW